MINTVIFVFSWCSASFALPVLDYPSTKMITPNLTGSYFGYSVLLQKGNPPAIIVGVPRKKYGDTNKGSVYKCDLYNLRCEEYSYFESLKGIYTSSKNGNFLGSAVDGDEETGKRIFACAPRFITVSHTVDHYINGRCFQIVDSSNVKANANVFFPLGSYNQIALHNGIPYYDAAFGQAGFDIVYLKDEKAVLTGAPGKSLWNGALVKSKLDSSSQENKIFSFQPDFTVYHERYYGYAAGWGRFIKGSRKAWYLSGGPRGCDLRGNIIFFDEDSRYLANFCGEEFGSYFGASILVMHRAEGGDDLLVGAPMYAGASYDEGCVYFYKNDKDGTFNSPVKLTRKETFSRFGTAMADLGDIDLDSHSDCAISAPYENDGVGAVYLYFGTEDGFSDDKFEKVTPSSFDMAYPKLVVRGFGMGVSKGSDINNDKHNDIVVGAFLSDQIFYFPSVQVIDVVKDLKSNMATLFTSTTNFVISYCIKFTFRNGDTSSKRSFVITLDLEDDRVINGKNITEAVTIQPSNFLCRNYTVYLKNNHLNLEPIVVNFGHKLYNTSDRSDEETLSIPVSYECGADNVCQTNLKISGTAANRTKIIIGETSELRVSVTINNSGESAYQTKLYIQLPPDVALINLRECDIHNETYVCLVSQMLEGTIEKNFLFDLSNLQPHYGTLWINFTVDSMGQDINFLDNKHRLGVPVTLRNNPYVDSRSTPDTIFVNRSEKSMQITHFFLVGNQGPSPVDLNFEMLVPHITINKSNVLHIQNVEGSLKTNLFKCQISNSTGLNIAMRSQGNPLGAERNGSLQNCTVISCKGGFLYKSNENTVFTLKLLLHLQEIEPFFRAKSKLVVTTTGFFQNGTKTFLATAATVVHRVPSESSISLWIYIVSIISGIVLLSLVVGVLYKCNFFKRSYKERLENEKSENEGFLQDEEEEEEEETEGEEEIQ